MGLVGLDGLILGEGFDAALPAARGNSLRGGLLVGTIC